MGKLQGKAKARARKKKALKDKLAKEKHRITLVDRIIKFDDPILKKVCETCVKGNHIKQISYDLKRILVATKNGVGLSGSQIGIAQRIFAARFKVGVDFVKIFINPEILYEDPIKLVANEGCLSYPNIFCNVERPYSIKIKYFDENWMDHIEEFKGFRARVIFHELDHMDGECIVQKAWKEKEADKVNATVS